MSVRTREIIAATTGIVTSVAFAPVGVATVTAGAFAVNEGVKVQFSHDAVTWQDLYLNGVLQEIDASHTMITIMGPGMFRCVKSLSVAAYSVTLWESEV